MKQRFSTRTRLVSALLTLAMVFTFLPFSAFAAGGTHAGSTIELSSSNFPDDAFREYLKATFDKNGDRKLAPAERNAVKKIDVHGGYNGQKIKDLTGIEFFPNLEILWCYDNQLTELDVSKNKELKNLDCDNNQLTSLQLDNCPKLGLISCVGNKYSVQVYDSTRILDPGTLPGNFDISRVGNLVGADKTADGKLKVRDGASTVAYEYSPWSDYYYHVIFTLNVEVIPGGIRIYGENFPNYEFRRYLKANIDKDGNGYLNDTELNIRTLDVSGQHIANLKGIEFFPNLETLWCYDNQLTKLDVSKNPELKELWCSNNKLTSLDVSENTALQELYCGQNNLTSLDVSKSTNLTILDCAKNKLTSLDVSQNPELQRLDCYDNQLTSLDVSKNTNLTILDCKRNRLTSLDVSQNNKLEQLYCRQNQLTSLKLSQTAVTTLDASDNQITIEVEETSRTFNLSNLPGFDVSKIITLNGGTVSGKTLTVDEGVDKVTYTYDCGKGFSRDFTLNVTVVPDGTVTPPTPGGDTPGGTTPGGSTGGGDGGGAIVIVAAAGAAVAGVVGYGVYNYVSGRKLQALLPEGVAAPENRAQTALLLWNTAGRPEPAEAPAFADVADPDTAKAAQWCVEQGLMKRRLNGKFAPGSSIPAYQVLNAYRKLAG